jgi:hypothetical protein
MMVAMKQPVLFLYFLCLVLAGGSAASETLTLNSYLMTFKGFSEDTTRGIEEYIVEFPGYTEHKLVSKELRGNEYRYKSSEAPEGIAASLRRMFTYLDVEGQIKIDEQRITVTHPLYEEPPVPEAALKPEPEVAPQARLQPSPPPAPVPKVTPKETPKPLALRLSTARGDIPAFAIGETFDLTVELSRNAWLYCFYRRVDGKVIKLFPNLYQEDAWMKGGQLHRIPGAIYPFELAFNEPPGNELLTCFAADRDVRADLPMALRVPDMVVLPPSIDRRLHELFDGLANVTIAHASMPITVTR